MTIQPILIPPEWNWAFDLVVGQGWPQADEDALRRIAQAWTDTLQGLLNIADGGNAVAQNVNYSVQARSSDEFNNYWRQYVDGDNSVIGQLAQQCEYLAEFVLSFAEQTEFTKLSINIQIVILIIQLIIDAALAIVTFGASTAEGVAATFVTREIVQGFLFHFLEGVLAAVLPDVITQFQLIREGHRGSFDAGEAFQALQMGVAGGLIGAGIGALGGSGPLGKLGGRFFGDAGEAGGTFIGGLLTNPMVHGAATNLATNSATGLIDSGEDQLHAAFDPSYAQQLAQQTQDQGYADQKAAQNPLIAMLNGAFMGAAFHGVHEGATDLAGFPEAQPLTLDNQQQFTAVQLQDGTGSNYALFDQNLHLVGTGTTDGSGNVTITLRDGGSYTAGITQPGDYSPAPATTGTIPVTPDLRDTPAAPTADMPSQEPTATDAVIPSGDPKTADQPVMSADHQPSMQGPGESAATPPVPADARSAAVAAQSPATPAVQADPQSTTATPPIPEGPRLGASTQPGSEVPLPGTQEGQPSTPVSQQPPKSPVIPASSDAAPQQRYQPAVTAEPTGQAATGPAAVQPGAPASTSAVAAGSQNSESPIPGPVPYPVSTPDATVGSPGLITRALSGGEQPGDVRTPSLPDPDRSGYQAFEHKSPGSDRLPATRPRPPLPDVPADAALVSSRKAGIYRLADDGTGIAKYGKVIDGQFHVIVEGDLPGAGEKGVYALFDRDTGEFLKFGQLSGSDALTRYSAENLSPGSIRGERDFRLEARGEGRYPSGYDRYSGEPPLSGRKVVIKIVASHLTPVEADAIEKHGLNEMWGGPANVEREYTDDNLFHRREMQNEAAAARNSFFDWVQQKIGTDPRWADLDLRALHAAFPDPGHEPALPGQPGGRPPYPLNANPVFHDDGSAWTGPSQHMSPHLAGDPGEEWRPYHEFMPPTDLAGAKPTAEELRARLMTMFHAAGDDPQRSNEMAIAYMPGTEAQPGRLAIIEGTRDSVGLPPGYEGYRIIAHTQLGEGPSEADRAAAIAAGHPLEMIVYHDDGRSRAELFNPYEHGREGIFDYNGEPKAEGVDRTQSKPLSAMLDRLLESLPGSPPGPSAGLLEPQRGNPIIEALTGHEVAGSQDLIMRGDMQRIGVEGAYVLEGHGAGGELFADGRRIALTSDALPGQLKDAGWDGRSPIVLAACEAQLGGAASGLAVRLGVRVIAVDTAVWRTPQGELLAAGVDVAADGMPRPDLHNLGTWTVNEPDGRTRDLAPEDNIRIPAPAAVNLDELVPLLRKGTIQGDGPIYIDTATGGQGEVQNGDVIIRSATPGTPPKIVEIGAGLRDTHYLPSYDEALDTIGTAPSSSPVSGDEAPIYAEITRTDLAQPGRYELDATQPAPKAIHDAAAALRITTTGAGAEIRETSRTIVMHQGVLDDFVKVNGQMDAVLINNNFGYRIDVDQLGTALREGGLLIVQGRYQDSRPNRFYQPFWDDMQQELHAPGSRLPAGYELISADSWTSPQLSTDAQEHLTPGEKPPQVIGGPFNSADTADRPLRWPDSRIVIRKIPASDVPAEPAATPASDLVSAPAPTQRHFTVSVVSGIAHAFGPENVPAAEAMAAAGLDYPAVQTILERAQAGDQSLATYIAAHPEVDSSGFQDNFTKLTGDLFGSGRLLDPSVYLHFSRNFAGMDSRTLLGRLAGLRLAVDAATAGRYVALERVPEEGVFWHDGTPVLSGRADVLIYDTPTTGEAIQLKVTASPKEQAAVELQLTEGIAQIQGRYGADPEFPPGFGDASLSSGFRRIAALWVTNEGNPLYSVDHEGFLDHVRQWWPNVPIDERYLTTPADGVPVTVLLINGRGVSEFRADEFRKPTQSEAQSYGFDSDWDT
jgi:hypothetical protein